MKDLAKTYAPLVALAIGFGCYWIWGTVSNLSEEKALLIERNTQLELLLANQCTVILEQQGYMVTLAPPEEPEEEPEDGEDAR